MKCCAPVSASQSLEYRTDRSRDLRCHRSGTQRIAGKWFCYQHGPVWQTHYEIVDRIRSIPNRDILDSQI